MFTPEDLQQLTRQGVTVDKVEAQLESFRTGFPDLDIVAPASTKKGIMALTIAKADEYIALWEEYLKEGHQVEKFVPASGAASRMFKALFQYLDDGIETAEIKQFLEGKDKFAFGPELAGKEGQEAVRYLLEDMNYGRLPKGLLLFHKYKDAPRTPAMEQMVEAALYAASAAKEGEVPVAKLHFTVSEEHLPLFRHHVAEVLPAMEKKYNVRYDISFSVQKKSTDTIAANADGTPFRNADGSLLFRPGGHGALIENLNEQDADIVFIKNIDNVVPDRLKKDTVRWKKVLAGPIRVCGVVKNTGEPGGGPFLVRDEDGRISCQILESSQIKDPELMAKSTHFNPVDLVCALRDKDGNAYNLPDYVDPKTGFISHKSKDGKELLALELPGLWNGAMAKWNTVFVQVPISTFNPVKTVNDLLRNEHQ